MGEPHKGPERTSINCIRSRQNQVFNLESTEQLSMMLLFSLLLSAAISIAIGLIKMRLMGQMDGMRAALEAFERLACSTERALSTFEHRLDAVESRLNVEVGKITALSWLHCTSLTLDARNVVQFMAFTLTDGIIVCFEALERHLTCLASEMIILDCAPLTAMMVGLEAFERLICSTESALSTFEHRLDTAASRLNVEVGKIIVLHLTLHSIQGRAHRISHHMAAVFQLAIGALFHHFSLLSILVGSLLIVIGIQSMFYLILALPVLFVEVLVFVMGMIALRTTHYRIIYLDDGRYNTTFQSQNLAYLHAKQQYMSYVAKARRSARRRERRREWRFWNGKGGGTASFTSEWRPDPSLKQQAALKGDLGNRPHIIEVHTRVTRPFPRLNAMEDWKRCGLASHLLWLPPSRRVVPPSPPAHQCSASTEERALWVDLEV